MTHNNDDSGLSDAPATIATPFTITIELLTYLKPWFRIDIIMEKDLHVIIDTIKKGATEAMQDMKTAVD